MPLIQHRIVSCFPTNTMAANLSDRIIESSKDTLQKITETDLVQKILMTGDLSGKHRAVAHRMYQGLTDKDQFSQNIFKDVAKLPGLTPEEKDFFLKMDETYPSIFSKYLADLQSVVGPVADDVMSAPTSPHIQEYQKFLTNPIEKGSVIHTLCSYLVVYAVPVAIYSYLVGSPSYKENELAKLFTFHTLGAEQALAAIKAFIDNRANEVTPDLEAELKALFKSKVEFDLEVTKILYEQGLE